VGCYANMRRSVTASNSQILAGGNHNWSGCGNVAHPAPERDSREKPVVNELVLEGSLLKDIGTTDVVFDSVSCARRGAHPRYDSHFHPSGRPEIDWTLSYLSLRLSSKDHLGGAVVVRLGARTVKIQKSRA